MSAWEDVRTFALGLPLAIEDTPWDELVVKIDHPPRRRGGLVYGPMFLWLGQPDATTVSVKLETSYDEAAALAGATPMTHSGLGQWGWLTIPLADADPGLLRDWVEESYLVVAPKRLRTRLRPDG